jgi:hypothetical protein
MPIIRTDPELALKWAIQTRREDWIKRFLDHTAAKCEISRRRAAYLLVLFHTDKTIGKILILLPNTPGRLHLVVIGGIVNDSDIHGGLFEAYNELCNDSLIQDAYVKDKTFRCYLHGPENSHSGHWASQSDENILHVMMRADFLTKVIETNDAFCGNFFTKSPLDTLRNVFRIIMDENRALTGGMKRFHKRIDQWVRWYWALGSPFHSSILNSYWPREDWITFRLHVLILVLAKDAGVTQLKSWYHLTNDKVIGYLKTAIEHDDVEEVEYMIENSPFPIDLKLVTGETIFRQEHRLTFTNDHKVMDMMKWCLDRLLITLKNFSSIGRTTISNQPEWQALAKTYPEFDADDEMCKFREGPDGSYYG